MHVPILIVVGVLSLSHIYAKKGDSEELYFLRKTIVNEQVLRTEMQRQITDLRDKLEKTNQKNQAVQKSIKQSLNEIKQKRESPVAFHAYFGGSRSIKWFSHGKIIVFDRITLNKGNAYNPSTGVFVVPEYGTYVFSTVMVAYDISWVNLELKVNGKLKDISFPDAGNHHDRSTATTVTVLQLRKGDHVYAATGLLKGGRFIESNGYARSSFSGWKL